MNYIAGYSGNYIGGYLGSAGVIEEGGVLSVCNVKIKLISLDGVKPAAATGTARVVSLPYEKEGWYISLIVNGAYNSGTGIITFPLVRTADVIIKVNNFGIDHRLTVPDAAEADFKDISGKVKV